MVQRVIYADNSPEQLELLLHQLGFGLYRKSMRPYRKHAQLEVQVVPVHDPDQFGTAQSRSRILVSDRHHAGGFEADAFCDAAKPVYEAILRAAENKVIYDPCNRVDY